MLQLQLADKLPQSFLTLPQQQYMRHLAGSNVYVCPEGLRGMAMGYVVEGKSCASGTEGSEHVSC